MEQNHCTTKTGKWKQLTERDRYKIEAYFQAGLKPQEIAAYIGCSKRTIERERRLGMTAQLKPATKNIKTCGDLQVQGDKAGNFNIGRTADEEITLCSDKEQESKRSAASTSSVAAARQRRLYARIQEYHGRQRGRVFGWRRNEACRQMRRGILRASIQQLGAWKQRKRESDAAQVSSQGHGLQQIEAEGTAADRGLGQRLSAQDFRI